MTCFKHKILSIVKTDGFYVSLFYLPYKTYSGLEVFRKPLAFIILSAKYGAL